MKELLLEYYIQMKKIDNYFETSISTYENDMDFAFLVTESNHDIDELNVLCIEAGGQLIQKVKNAFKSIIDAIKTFIKNLYDKINMKVCKAKVAAIISTARKKSIKNIKKDFRRGNICVDEAKFKIQQLQLYYVEYNHIINKIIELSDDIRKMDDNDESAYIKSEKILKNYLEQFMHALNLEHIAISANINNDIACASSDLNKIEKLLDNVTAKADENINKIYHHAESADDGDGVPNPNKIRLLKQCAVLISECAKHTSKTFVALVIKRNNAIIAAINNESSDKSEPVD